VRALWSRFAITGNLPERGCIEPGVLSFSRIVRPGNLPARTAFDSWRMGDEEA
jgi:hypothetical protein